MSKLGRFTTCLRKHFQCLMTLTLSLMTNQNFPCCSLCPLLMTVRFQKKVFSTIQYEGVVDSNNIFLQSFLVWHQQDQIPQAFLTCHVLQALSLLISPGFALRCSKLDSILGTVPQGPNKGKLDLLVNTEQYETNLTVVRPHCWFMFKFLSPRSSSTELLSSQSVPDLYCFVALYGRLCIYVPWTPWRSCQPVSSAFSRSPSDWQSYLTAHPPLPQFGICLQTC